VLDFVIFESKYPCCRGFLKKETLRRRCSDAGGPRPARQICQACKISANWAALQKRANACKAQPAGIAGIAETKL